MPALLNTEIPSPVGPLRARARGDTLCYLRFSCGERPDEPVDTVPADAFPLFRELADQLGRYFAGTLRSFDLPLAPEGTPFQHAVWELLREIPYGATQSYGELAGKLGNRNKARAVGGAAHVNPIAILIPCHRLIGSSGALTGFASGLNIKKFLLELEGTPHNG